MDRVADRPLAGVLASGPYIDAGPSAETPRCDWRPQSHIIAASVVSSASPRQLAACATDNERLPGYPWPSQQSALVTAAGRQPIILDQTPAPTQGFLCSARQQAGSAGLRSEERRVGRKDGSTWRSRWSA